MKALLNLGSSAYICLGLYLCTQILHCYLKILGCSKLNEHTLIFAMCTDKSSDFWL